MSDTNAVRRPPKQVAWPRCRWCHCEISRSVPVPYDRAQVTDPFWLHVTTGRVGCEGRSNAAEPVPQIEEEPFMAAAWEFVARYRKLRRAFREISQSRASAVRRMQDYQKLADALIEAYEGDFEEDSEALFSAIQAIRDYRRSQLSAGWR